MVDERYFQDLVERNEFVEWAQVYGHRYNRPRTAMVDMMDHGIDVLLEIDVQGARQIRKSFDDAVFVYILPSIEALRVRAEQRGSDSAEEIQRRLQKVREEMWSYREYDYIVKNYDMTSAGRPRGYCPRRAHPDQAPGFTMVGRKLSSR